MSFFEIPHPSSSTFFPSLSLLPNWGPVTALPIFYLFLFFPLPKRAACRPVGRLTRSLSAERADTPTASTGPSWESKSTALFFNFFFSPTQTQILSSSQTSKCKSVFTRSGKWTCATVLLFGMMHVSWDAPFNLTEWIPRAQEHFENDGPLHFFSVTHTGVTKGRIVLSSSENRKRKTVFWSALDERTWPSCYSLRCISFRWLSPASPLSGSLRHRNIAFCRKVFSPTLENQRTSNNC